jgi:hypothetical protein
MGNYHQNSYYGSGGFRKYVMHIYDSRDFLFKDRFEESGKENSQRQSYEYKPNKNK